jgi:hypothetical protein
LARRRDNTLARYWSALYMQNPVPDEGELFSPDRIGVKATAEDVFLWVRAWDLAGSVEGDWTVGVLMGKTRKGSLLVPDNLKSGVNKASFYDLEINRTYGAMAAHYSVGILPVRPGKPRDKARAFRSATSTRHCEGLPAQASDSKRSG